MLRYILRTTSIIPTAFSLSLAITALVSTTVTTAEAQTTISQIVVRQTTADVRYAKTNDDFVFTVRWGASSCSRDFPDLPYDERERGKTDTYTFNVANCNVPMNQLTGSQLFIRTKGQQCVVAFVIQGY